MAKKKTPQRKSGKEDDYNIQKPENWTAKKQQQGLFTMTNFTTVCGILMVFLMVYLLLFVDETKFKKEQAEKRQNEKKKKAQEDYVRKEFVFKYTDEQEMDALTEILQAEDDEIKVVVFDYSEDPPEKPGRGPIKAKYLWKRYERIAKSLRTKELFKRYDEEDLPKIYRFDCTGPGQLLCDRIVRDKAPSTIILKNKRPRAMPEDVKSDKQILQYLFDQMQPAVSYKETMEDVDEFVDAEGLQVMFYGNEREPLEFYTQGADVLRDIAKFGRSRNDDAIAKYTTDEDPDPCVKLYRKFDESPVVFPHELSMETLKDFVNFVRTNSLPLLAEFSPSIHSKYQKRGLPIVWLHVDSTEDETDRILEEATELAKGYYGEMSFTYIDGVVNAQVAKNIGSTSMPQILILDGKEEVKEDIDVDMPRASIQAAIDKWKKKNDPENDHDIDDDEDDEDDYYAEEDLEDDDGDLAGDSEEDEDDEGADGDEGEEDDGDDKEL